MKSKSLAAAAALAVVVGASSLNGQTPAGTAKGEQVTVSGCVQRETDYRKANDKGRGGVAGTGIGAADEFVLANVTAGATKDTAYELTGPNEKLAAAHVGHRVEITGMLKAAEVTAGGKPTGGATAGTPPKGVDVASKDLRLRELEVTSVKMVSATCTTP